jgi:hypothetical protein
MRLQRHRPRVDDAMLVMRAFPAERPSRVHAATTKSRASWKRSRLKAGLTPAASCSWPPPRTKPETNRPFEIMSIIDNSSASRTGFSARGNGLPSNIIFAVLVVAARIEAKMLQLPACRTARCGARSA